jgi:hypothetical protein
MIPGRRDPTPTVATLSILSALALTMAACRGGSSSGGTSSGEQPVRGGTLKLLGSSDVDHLDTASAYYTTSYTLERAFTRQLFSYLRMRRRTARETRANASRCWPTPATQGGSR